MLSFPGSRILFGSTAGILIPLSDPEQKQKPAIIKLKPVK
jgi:hypothetical protein